MELILFNTFAFTVWNFILAHDIKNEKYKSAIISGYFAGVFLAFLLCSIINMTK